MAEKTEQLQNPVEVWYRVTYSNHYYPPIRELRVQRDDIQDEKRVKQNMSRMIRQGAYASIILSLCIAGCIFIAGLAAYAQKVTIKDIACFVAFIGISYLCRVDSIKQKKASLDFWNYTLDEAGLQKKTDSGRIMITLLFLAFVAVAVAAFYHVFIPSGH
ncbi:MAG: hypothetical protein JNL72_07165 [Flavipsychrobacter sp.]|nr:hypothetical protein [Flavipsychrobacter sp.]